MNSYMVLYRIESIMSPMDPPFGFHCFADSVDHAEEQCTDAYPECDIVGVCMDKDYEDSLMEYYTLSLDFDE